MGEVRFVNVGCSFFVGWLVGGWGGGFEEGGDLVFVSV